MSNLIRNIVNGIGTTHDPNTYTQIYDRKPLGMDWQDIRAIYKNNELCHNAINFKSQTPIKNGRKWRVESDDPEDSKKIEKFEEKIEFKRVIREALFHMYLYGGCLVLMHTESDEENLEIEETIKEPSLLWSEPLNPNKEKIKELSIVPIYRVVSLDLNNNILSDDFLKPEFFNVQGAKVHVSRCLAFRRNISIDYFFNTIAVKDYFGFSIFEEVETLIKIYEANNNTLLDLAQDSSRIIVNSKNLGDKIFKAGGRGEVQEIFRQMNFSASNKSITVLGDGDEMSVLEKNYLQIIESQKDITLRLCGAFGVPEVLALGKAMTGLSQNVSEYLAIYYEPFAEFQNSDLRSFLKPFDDIMIRQCGFREEQVSYEWNSLFNLTEKEKAELDSLKLANLTILKELANLTHEEIISEIDSANLANNLIKGLDPESQFSFSPALQDIFSQPSKETQEEKVEEHESVRASKKNKSNQPSLFSRDEEERYAYK